MMEQDCFAYKNRRCKALKIQKCEGTGCGFFKTKSQVEEDQRRVFKRIKSLDEVSRRHIMDLYYGGKMELLDEVEVD